MNGFDATKKFHKWEDRERPGASQPIFTLTVAYVDDFERGDLMKFKERDYQKILNVSALYICFTQSK